MPVNAIIGWIFLGLGLVGALYALLAAAMARRLLSRPPTPLPAKTPTVTVLKPLYGLEPGMEEALAATLAQDYPAAVQFVFGLHDAADPARTVVERLKARFADRDIALVIDAARHGSNGKVSNLINMMAAARHDVLVIADSDIAVPAGWLTQVVAALSQDGIGAVSCFYVGEGRSGPWARLGAMAVSYHFLPNVLVGVGLGLADPCFGSTIALRRTTLEAIGGLAAFADLLADDYEIGRAVRASGSRIAYPPLVVRHAAGETNAGDLLAHELRWARTIRVIDPAGHAGSAVTHALPLGLIGAACLGFNPVSIAGLALILGARLFLKARMDHIVGEAAGPHWLLPVRDVLSFAVFLASLFGRSVAWRGARLQVAKSGTMSG